MSTLALDLGTKTGWAVGTGDTRPDDMGTFTLMSPKEVTAQHKVRFDRRLDARIPRLYESLSGLHEIHSVKWIVFEDVQFASTTLQAHLWASLRATVWLFTSLHGINIECLATGKLKLFGSGHGGATKEMMAEALTRTLPEAFIYRDGFAQCLDTRRSLDDNAVDAVHLYLWAMKTLNK